jgi:hypothetical protein
MRAWRRWVGGAAAIVIAAACGRRPEAGPASFDVAAEFTKVTAAHAAFVAARGRLERAGSPATGGDGDAASGDRVRESQAAYDVAYANEQRVLAAFLNQALNLAPARPETRQALAMYADAAAVNAGYLARNGGDGRQALPALAAADRAYRALGIPPPAALSAALAEAGRPQAPTPTPTATAPPRRPARRHRR